MRLRVSCPAWIFTGNCTQARRAGSVLCRKHLSNADAEPLIRMRELPFSAWLKITSFRLYIAPDYAPETTVSVTVVGA